MEFKGKIYKLICSCNYFYYGCTTLNLNIRLQNHISFSKNKKIKLYIHINNNCGWNNVKILPIEEKLFNNRKELFELETKYIKKNINNPFCLNKNISYRSLEEKKILSKQYKGLYRKKYPNKRKIETIKYRRKYKEELKIRKKLEYQKHKEHYKIKQKERYEKNKEYILKQQKEYQEKNKAKLSEKFECDICGGNYTTRTKKTHEKTIKHLSGKKIENRITCDICGGKYTKKHKSDHFKTKNHKLKEQESKEKLQFFYF